MLSTTAPMVRKPPISRAGDRLRGGFRRTPSRLFLRLRVPPDGRTEG